MKEILPKVRGIACVDVDNVLVYEGKLPATLNDSVNQLDRALLRKTLNQYRNSIHVVGKNTRSEMGSLLQAKPPLGIPPKIYEVYKDTKKEESLLVHSLAIKEGVDVLVLGGRSCYAMFEGMYDEFLLVVVRDNLVPTVLKPCQLEGDLGWEDYYRLNSERDKEIQERTKRLDRKLFNKMQRNVIIDNDLVTVLEYTK